MTGLSRIISTAGRIMYPSLLWKFDLKVRAIYLTFDDGPIPEITPWVLATLKQYNAKATFFCIGHNIYKNPSIYQEILNQGHTVGNHTFNHLNGWKTHSDIYLKNVLQAEQVAAVNKSPFPLQSRNNGIEHSDKKLFRPPFGKITPVQIKKLEKLNYQIVMWDVISEDYRQNKLPQQCIKDVVTYAMPGSIVVFHDSTKARRNLQESLPAVLNYYSEKGFEFRAL